MLLLPTIGFAFRPNRAQIRQHERTVQNAECGTTPMAAALPPQNLSGLPLRASRLSSNPVKPRQGWHSSSIPNSQCPSREAQIHICDGLAFRKCLMDNLCDGVTAQNPWTAAIRRISVLNSPLAMLPATQGCQPRLRNRREYRSMLIINVLRRSTFQPKSTPVKAGQGWSRGSFSSFILHESGQSKSR